MNGYWPGREESYEPDEFPYSSMFAVQVFPSVKADKSSQLEQIYLNTCLIVTIIINKLIQILIFMSRDCLSKNKLVEIFYN